MLPDLVIVVGVNEQDTERVRGHPLLAERGIILHSATDGIPRQRNLAIDELNRSGFLSSPSFCAFLDDDLRPANQWLEQAAAAFQSDAIAGLQGHLISEGRLRTAGLGEQDAAEFLRNDRPPESSRLKTSSTLYGCNMAFRNFVLTSCRFDERLPLYAWLEDVDFSGQAKKRGRLVKAPLCRSVHMRVGGGRIEDTKLGYSQISNPIYLVNKRTLGGMRASYLASRGLASNLIRGVGQPQYRRRLRGNLLAISDCLRLRFTPERASQLQC